MLKVLISDIITVMRFGEKIISPVKEWFQKQTAEQKRRLILICTAAFSLLLTLLVVIPLAGNKKETPAEPAMRQVISPIPATELFIPDEPDFIPQILPGRERRSSWTKENAEEFWQDPLKQGEDQWREQIETAIDKFLERIP